MLHKNFIKYEQTFERNQLVTFHSHDYLRTKCRKGNKWITDGSDSNIIVYPGMQYQSLHNGWAVIETLCDAQLLLLNVPVCRARHPNNGNGAQTRLRYLRHTTHDLLLYVALTSSRPSAAELKIGMNFRAEPVKRYALRNTKCTIRLLASFKGWIANLKHQHHYRVNGMQMLTI